ncbi:MAG: VWA domain-containing protein [Hyphomicrobiales bacterium]|nr:VWA domain-containing protein [Hyphomicrobiales bacterium]
MLKPRLRHGMSLMRDTNASAAVIFALSLVPLIGGASVAVDYAQFVRTRTALQQAVDSAALSGVKTAAMSNPPAIRAAAQTIVNAQFNRPELTTVSVDASYDKASQTLSVSGAGAWSTSMTRALGLSAFPVSVTAKAAFSTGSLQLALVLDNTGSMNSAGKIGALKGATHNLIAQLKSLPGDIKVSIVPFDTHVNVGASAASQPWMDWSYFSATDPFAAAGDPQTTATSGCTASGVANATGGANSCTDHDHCDDAKAPADNGAGKCVAPVAASAPANWTGCVIDRDQPYDVQNTLPSSDPATWYPGVNCNLATLLPLTNDWVSLDAKVDQMQAAGMTDLTIGLAWGWNMLTPNAPLSTATAGPGANRILVFLTDGVNTKNAWSSNAAQIDARTSAICSNIKKDGVTIYTIRVIDGNAALLQACASDPAKYFDVSAAGQLQATFKTLLQQFSSVKLVR